MIEFGLEVVDMQVCDRTKYILFARKHWHFGSILTHSLSFSRGFNLISYGHTSFILADWWTNIIEVPAFRGRLWVVDDEQLF